MNPRHSSPATKSRGAHASQTDRKKKESQKNQIGLSCCNLCLSHHDGVATLRRRRNHHRARAPPLPSPVLRFLLIVLTHQHRPRRPAGTPTDLPSHNPKLLCHDLSSCTVQPAQLHRRSQPARTLPARALASSCPATSHHLPLLSALSISWSAKKERRNKEKDAQFEEKTKNEN